MSTFQGSADARLFSLLIGLWLASAVTANDAVAQIKRYRSTPKVASSEVIARLERGEIRSRSIRAAFEMDRMIDDSTMYRGNYEQYTDAERAQFLDGLERIARVGIPGDDGDAMTDAFATLYFIAVSPSGTGRQVQEIPGRLMRIYEQTTSRESKWLAVRNLGQVLRGSPTDAPDIIRLLVGLIKQPVTAQETLEGTKQFATEPVAPYQALDALFEACEVSVPVLRQLHADRQSIPDNETRARIEAVADQGFNPKRFELSTGWQGYGSTGPCDSGR